jgi:glutamyl-tRNA synthetase
VPDGDVIQFIDGNCGPQQFVAGKDFGDFVVWRNDGVPAYQLACVSDDAAMQITEVVRGADLLVSTARQILLYRALKVESPNFYHCELMNDEHGTRLAKRHAALSLRTFREQNIEPQQLRPGWIG